MKKLIYLVFEKLALAFKRKNYGIPECVQSESLDRLEHFLRSGRYLEGISK